jgi:hypothetical protein
MNHAQYLEVAKRNDAFRRSGERVSLTRGVKELPDLPGLLEEVRTYDWFTLANDMFEEHDFGDLRWHGEGVYWKISYCNEAMPGLVHPLSKRCVRELTVGLAAE